MLMHTLRADHRAAPATPAAAPASHVPAIDLLRMLAMFSVAATHTLAWAGRDTPAAARWYRILDLGFRTFTLPVFLLVAGAVLAHSARLRPQAPATFLRRRVVRLAVPWAIWSLIWGGFTMVLPALQTGSALPTLQDVVDALDQGPGYLYFLVVLVQLSLLLPLLPVRPRGRAVAAALAVGSQLLFTEGRLLLPGAGGPFGWLVFDHAYELGISWVGFFAIGTLVGLDLERYARPTAWRVVAASAIGVAALIALVQLPETGWWDADRLAGANILLHPLYLPAASAWTLLLYWSAGALLKRARWLLPWAARAGTASFGIYLVHGYFLDIMGPWMQPADAAVRISEQLPESLPAAAALLALTFGAAVVTVAVLSQFSWGRVLIGEARNLRSAPAAGRASQAA